MTPEELIDKYNPLAYDKLSQEDLDNMRTLTDDEIEVLAIAYPNTPTGNTYLRYFDTRYAPDKQLYPLGSWQNLYNLRKKLKQSFFQPFTFTALWQPQRPAPKPTEVFPSNRNLPKAEPIDLTEHEIAGLPGATGSKQKPTVRQPKLAKGVTKKELPENK